MPRRNALKISLLLTLLALSYCYSLVSQYDVTSRGELLEPYAVGKGDLGPPQMHGSPASQTERVIVLLAELSDAPNSTSAVTINSTIFDEMATYYSEVSYNELIVAGNITEWIQLSNSTIQYGKNTGTAPEGIDDVDSDEVPDAWWLLRDVVSKTDDTLNFAAYDIVMVVHSGGDEARSGVDNDIWSAYYYGLEIPTNDGVIITSGIVISEEDPLGIFAHEFGHSLGLPDLYSYSGPELVGNWDLMAMGSWLGSPQGSSPSHPTSWCKLQLGWIGNDSLLIGRSIQGVVDRLELKGNNITAIKIPLTTDTYYLVEVRQKVLYDSYLPTVGVLILYVDESLTSGKGIVRVKYSQSLSAATYTASIGNNMYIDSTSNVNVTVLSAYSSSYSVSVGLINPDMTAPSINVVTPVPWTLPPTQPGRVVALITDVGSNSSSVKNATVAYSSDGGHTWNHIAMDPSPHDRYTAVIPPQNSSQVSYYIEAYDYAGNLAIANNSGHYYVYGIDVPALVVAGIVITIGALICIAAAISFRRRRPQKVATLDAKLQVQSSVSGNL
jgi:immune inhibitor A